MSERTRCLKNKLTRVYNHNPYVNALKISIGDLHDGVAVLTMPIETDIHTNLYQIAHGGAIASLADTAMGVACATLDKKVVTLDMNLNYIKSAPGGTKIKAVGKVLHNGGNTMVAEAELHDESGGLISKARGTFFVIGKFEHSA